jgi:2-succinyl-6-hydroxy-2,4-cyclohexadiene-1-carboxylate synthase
MKKNTLTCHEFSAPTASSSSIAFDLVFLHGFMGCADDFKEVAAYAGKSGKVRRMVALDLPGHGPSAALIDNIQTTAEALQLMADSITALKLERTVLIGYSMGARLLLHLVLSRPELAQGVVLESVTPGIEDDGERALRRTLDDRLLKNVIENKEPFQEFLERFYDNPIFKGLKDHPNFAGMVARKLHQNPESLQKALNLFSPGTLLPLWPHIPLLSIPILVITGEEDTRYVQTGKRMRLLNPAIHIDVCPACSHNTHMQSPELFWNRIERFINCLNHKNQQG